MSGRESLPLIIGYTNQTDYFFGRSVIPNDLPTVPGMLGCKWGEIEEMIPANGGP